MARYIDADKIDYTATMVGRDEYAGYRAVAFESDIDAMPTADVAPRAEVAREIFDELEEVLCGEFLTERFWFGLGKLRIKYIEGQK